MSRFGWGNHFKHVVLQVFDRWHAILEILYEGFRLCTASFVSILGTFLLDLELSETIRFLFRSNPGCGWWCSWGSAQNSLCELQLPMPKTPWLERREMKATGANQDLRYFWRFSVDSWKWDFITTDSQNDPNNKNVAQWYPSDKLSVSHSLRTYGQALNREATEGPPDSVLPGWGPTVATWHSYTICLPVAFPSLCFAPSPNP